MVDVRLCLRIVSTSSTVVLVVASAVGPYSGTDSCTDRRL